MNNSGRLGFGVWVGKDITDRIYEGAYVKRYEYVYGHLEPSHRVVYIDQAFAHSLVHQAFAHSLVQWHTHVRTTPHAGYSWRVGAIARWWYATKVTKAHVRYLYTYTHRQVPTYPYPAQLSMYL